MLNSSRQEMESSAEHSAKIAAIICQSVLVIAGFAMNALLMFAISRHSPASFKKYSSLLFITSVNDIICIACDAVLIQRTIPTPIITAQVWHGVCSVISEGFCYTIFSIYLHTFTNAIALMVVSFWYRYVKVRYSESPRLLTLSIVMMLLYIPSFAQMITLPLSASPEAVVRAAITKYYPNLSENAAVTGNPSSGNIYADYGTYYPVLMPIPCYVFILVVRSKILRMLRRTGSHLSERTKEMHIQLVRTLTFHACLPVFTLIADTVFTIMLMDVYRHPLLENFVFFFTSASSCLSPIFTLLLIRPYRAFILREARTTRIETNDSVVRSA